MYLQHFGLTSTPFSLTPNTAFFVGVAPHIEAMEVLQSALQTNEGFIKVIGEVGTGKTLLCRKLLNELSTDFCCAYLPNPYLSPGELRWAVAMELGIDFNQNLDQQQLFILIQQRLFDLANQNKTVVLVVDEAQALPSESLEALRLFTNLETESCKLLQVVLFGQPELKNRLKEHKFRQLRQRITFSYELRPLTANETFAYINYRLSVSGYQGQPLITAKQAKYLSLAAKGVPRLVNILTHKALLLCYGEGRSKISNRHLKFAIKDTESAEEPNILKWLYMSAFSGVLLTLSVSSIYFLT